MAICKAKTGNFECGLIPLKEGLCEKHYLEMTDGKPIYEQDCSTG